MTRDTATQDTEHAEWLNVLPGRKAAGELTPEQLLALVTAPGVTAAGARVEAHPGQDASGQRRIRLRVSHAETETVALTRDALLHAGRRLGLRVFLV